MASRYTRSDRSSSDLKYKFEVILLGNSGVGKSCFLNRLVNDNFNIEPSTVGIELRIKYAEFKGEDVKVVIHDTGGQERYASSIPDQYFRQANGVLVMFDLTRIDTFEKVPALLKKVKEKCHRENVVIKLVGCKVDWTPRQVSQDKALQFASSQGMSYEDTSAKQNTNVDKVFHNLVVDMCNKKDSTPSVNNGEGGTDSNRSENIVLMRDVPPPTIEEKISSSIISTTSNGQSKI